MSYTYNLQVLSNNLDMTKLTPEKSELATLTRENGKTRIKILLERQVDELRRLRQSWRLPRRRRPMHRNHEIKCCNMCLKADEYKC